MLLPCGWSVLGSHPMQGRSMARVLRSGRLSLRGVVRGLQSLPVFDTKITTLDSGLRVASEARHGQTATVGVYIDAGSRYETPGNNGAAHFLEHLAFKGTNRRTRVQLEEEVENMGAHLNAYTSREQTVYFARCFEQDIGHSMDILSDILLSSQLSSMAVEQERGVILREMQEVYRQYEEVILDLLHEAAFSTSGLGMTILGPEQNIRSLAREQFRAYIDTHYTAPRMVIAAAGAVDHDELVQLSDKFWGHLPVEPKTNYPTNFDPATFFGSDVRWPGHDDAREAHIAVGFEGSSWTAEHAFPLMIIQCMLGTWDRLSGTGTKLPSFLAQELAGRGLCHSYNCVNISYKDTGLFGVYIVGEPALMLQALQVTAQHIKRFSEPGLIGEDELAIAKVQLKASWMQQATGFSQICDEIGRQLLTYGRRMTVDELFDEIDRVTLHDIHRCASEYLIHPDKPVAFAALGNIAGVPDYETCAKMFKR